MVDWEQVAEMNGLTPSEFMLEIFTIAALLGAKHFDKKGTPVRFKCSDDAGEIEVFFTRPEKNGKVA